MKNLLIVILLLVIGGFCQAQSSAYVFTAGSTNPLAQMTSPTLLLGSFADDRSAMAIEFPFIFGGKQYQKIYANTNGFVSLDVSPEEFAFDNCLTEAGTYPLISVWGDDLCTASNGSVCYQVMGAYPNRKLVVEWKVRKFSDRTNVYNKSFQLWLFEGTGKMQFVYGKAFVDDFNGGAIGVASTATDFLSVDALSNTASATEAITNWGAWPTETSYTFEPAKTAEPLQVKNLQVYNVSCFGKNDGSIALKNISGGSGNFQITWSSKNGYSAEGASIKSLEKGDYRYAITDGAQTIEGSVTIKEPTPIAFSVQSTDANVFGNKGTITVFTKGTFAIVDSVGTVVTSQKYFNPGTYMVTATGNGGNAGESCAATPTTVVIAVPGKNYVGYQVNAPVSRAKSLKVFPNPSTGKFTVSVRNASTTPASIKIYTMGGKLVATEVVPYAKAMQEFNFNFSTLPEGYYVVEYVNGQDKYASKLIIRR